MNSVRLEMCLLMHVLSALKLPKLELAKFPIWQRPNRPHGGGRFQHQPLGSGVAGNDGDRLHLLLPLRFARSALKLSSTVCLTGLTPARRALIAPITGTPCAALKRQAA